MPCELPDASGRWWQNSAPRRTMRSEFVLCRTARFASRRDAVSGALPSLPNESDEPASLQKSPGTSFSHRATIPSVLGPHTGSLDSSWRRDTAKGSGPPCPVPAGAHPAYATLRPGNVFRRCKIWFPTEGVRIAAESFQRRSSEAHGRLHLARARPGVGIRMHQAFTAIFILV
jgi:hypothetical protein